MLYYKPITVERARVNYFRSMNDVNYATDEIERDRARSNHRKDLQILQNAQWIQRNRDEAAKRTVRRRRIDWNTPVF